MSHSESESVFAPKLLSCVLLSSPDCLAGMEASHGVLQTVSEHLGGEGEEEEDSPTVIDREAIYLRRMLAATSDGGGRLSLPKGTEVSLEDVDEKDTFDEEEEDFMVKRQDRRRRGNSGGNQVRDSPFNIINIPWNGIQIGEFTSSTWRPSSRPPRPTARRPPGCLGRRW